MKGLNKILLEGRIEDAQQYFEKAVGDWPVAELNNHAGIGDGTNLQGVLEHFVQNDPSGNNKYLMWMVKMYVNPEERGTSPNDISSLVQRFHNNVDRLNMSFIMNMGIFTSHSKIMTSPKNIDSYDDLSQLERVLDEVDSLQTKKEKEDEAKSGVDKLYQDDRWLLVRPNTYEGSCYYGSATKWCTASRDAKQHFDNYSKSGNLFYIIDKKQDVGDFFKIALHKAWSGKESWYDRADDELTNQTIQAIRSILPKQLIHSLEAEHSNNQEEKNKDLTLAQFKSNIETYIQNLTKPITISTPTGKWVLEISAAGTWEWGGNDPRVELIATPFYEGHEDMEIYFTTDDDDLGQPAIEYRGYFGLPDLSTEYLGPGPDYHWNYLSVNSNEYRRPFGVEKAFIAQIYIPRVSQALASDEIKEYTGLEYTTWDAQSYVSSYTFKYPPKAGGMTQLFTEYLKGNPRRTSNQFYEEVLGRNRPRGHNNMFFAAIKDSGIVKMERSGRQFVYSLGPNYEAWTKGKLLRKGRAYGQPG